MQNGVKLKDLKKGEYFTLKPIAAPSEYQVCIKGEYDRSAKKYDCGCFHDISLNRLIDGNRTVYTDFVF